MAYFVWRRATFIFWSTDYREEQWLPIPRPEHGLIAEMLDGIERICKAVKAFLEALDRYLRLSGASGVGLLRGAGLPVVLLLLIQGPLNSSASPAVNEREAAKKAKLVLYVHENGKMRTVQAKRFPATLGDPNVRMGACGKDENKRVMDKRGRPWMAGRSCPAAKEIAMSWNRKNAAWLSGITTSCQIRTYESACVCAKPDAERRGGLSAI